MTKNQDNFLYQINFNRRKYPEICEALERAKEENGIAFYLRKLILNDIYSQDKTIYVEQRSIDKVNTSSIKLDQENDINNENDKKINKDLPDDSGGFI